MDTPIKKPFIQAIHSPRADAKLKELVARGLVTSKILQTNTKKTKN